MSWNGISGASAYTLQEQANGGSWTTIQSAGSTSDAISGKADGSYGYRVQACNGTICAPWSGTATTTVVHPPATPASITVPATSSGNVAVSWAASSTATSYTLQQKLGSGSWGTVYTGSATNKAVTVSSTGSYTYQVKASNAGGDSGWKASSAVAVTLPPTGVPALTVPSASNNGSYTVSWSAVSTATSYTLREQVNGGAWTNIQTANAVSKALSGKADGTYGYQIQACNTGGCAGWSGTSSVKVTHPPATPASITVPATSSGSVAVSWAASSKATSYTLQQKLGSGSWSTVYTGSATSKTVTVSSTGSYTYQVKASNTGGDSGWKASSAVAVTIPPANAPSLTVPATTSTGSYTVSWGAVTAATSYTLQEKVGSGSWSTIQTASATSKALSGKANNTQYAYRVEGCNAGGCGPWSNTGTVATPPPVPGNVVANDLVANGKMETLTVVWSASSGAVRYDVRRDSNGGIVYNGTSTSTAVQNGPFPLLLDDYAVRACNAYVCSVWAEASLQQATPPPTSAPSLTVPASSTGSYTVSWGTVTNATTYTLQESTNGGGWVTRYSGASQSKAYSGKAVGSYGYRVQACNPGGCGAWSGTKSITVAPAPAVPAVPTGVHVSDDIAGRKENFTASWNAVSTATSYQILRVETGATVYSGTATTHILESGFSPYLEQYSYKLRACNAAGCSAWTGTFN